MTGHEDGLLASLFDDHGASRDPSAAARYPAEGAYLVFSQQRDATLPSAALHASARRFFAADLEVGPERANEAAAGELDSRLLRITSDDPTASGVRVVHVRPASPDDHARADRAEATAESDGARAGGLSQLARRCPYALVVSARGSDDRVSLTLAAILASVSLGPIVAPDGRRIYGVRGARIALEATPPGYR